MRNEGRSVPLATYILEDPISRRRVIKSWDMVSFSFSDQSEVIASLSVSEYTDNDSLIIARDNFIMAAKLAHGEEFNEAQARYAGGEPVTILKAQSVVNRFSGIIDGYVEEKISPWKKLTGIFKK